MLGGEGQSIESAGLFVFVVIERIANRLAIEGREFWGLVEAWVVGTKGISQVGRRREETELIQQRHGASTRHRDEVMREFDGGLSARTA